MIVMLIVVVIVMMMVIVTMVAVQCVFCVYAPTVNHNIGLIVKYYSTERDKKSKLPTPSRMPFRALSVGKWSRALLACVGQLRLSVRTSSER